MARSLVLSNGELHIRLNSAGMVNALHFPYVGHENHTPNSTHRIGVWVDGRMSWIDDGNWSYRAKYPAGSLVGHSVAVNEDIGIILEFEDLVEADANLLIRNIHIINIREYQRSIRLFCHQAFTISGYEGDDTAQYLPADNSILHYKGRRAFVIGGVNDVGQGFDQYTVGRFGQGLDGTWRDAEDGELSMSSSECGQTDSTVGFSMIIGGLSSRRVHYWLIASTSVRAAIGLDANVRKHGVYKRLASTTDWWRKYLNSSFKVSDQLEPKYRKSFIDSLMMIRSHIDRRGAIIHNSATSSQSLCDPRVGSLAIWPMIRLGFKQEAISYFTFMRQSLMDDGYLAHKYRADGSIGPVNLPYDGKLAPLDSSHTAVTLFVFSQMYALNKQPKLLRDFYQTLVVPMANFLSDYTDDRGLPLPGYDSSSSHKETTSLTTSLTYAALMAAVELADYSKDQDSSVKWRTAAEEMRAVATDVFIKDDLVCQAEGSNNTSAASLYGAFMFGLLDIDHPALSGSAKYLERNCMLSSKLFHVSGEVDYIGSLWMAQYYMETGEQAKADVIIDQVSDIITSPDPKGGELDSLIYAEYVSTLLDKLTRK